MEGLGQSGFGVRWGWKQACARHCCPHPCPGEVALSAWAHQCGLLPLLLCMHACACFFSPSSLFGRVAVGHSHHCVWLAALDECHSHHCVWLAALDEYWAIFMDCLSCGSHHCCTQEVLQDGVVFLCTCMPVCFPSSPVGVELGHVHGMVGGPCQSSPLPSLLPGPQFCEVPSSQFKAGVDQWIWQTRCGSNSRKS
jgi:hypothetical protein